LDDHRVEHVVVVVAKDVFPTAVGALSQTGSYDCKLQNACRKALQAIPRRESTPLFHDSFRS